jgi:hypothetical protein
MNLLSAREFVLAILPRLFYQMVAQERWNAGIVPTNATAERVIVTRLFRLFLRDRQTTCASVNAHGLRHMMKLSGERAPAGLASMLKEELRQCVNGS